MAVNRHVTKFNLREDILDSITPSNTVQDEVRAPAGEWKPAAWLPIQFTKTNASAGTDAFVVSSGKVVALDTEGRVVPAGLRTALGGNSATSVFGSTVLTYTATDVTWGVIDLTTGERVTAAATYTGEEVCDALIERGLVREDDVIAAGGTVPVTNDAHCNVVIDLFISHPIGVAAYDYHVWSGRPEDGDQWFTNYSKQHLVQFLTELQMKMPHRVAGAETSDTFDADALNTAGSTAYAAGSAIVGGEYWNATNFSQLARYSAASATTPAVALGLDSSNVAKNTDRTPVTCDRAGVLVRERFSVLDLAVEGDWYLDYEVGVLFLHEDTWTTLVALGTANTNFLYNYYVDTGLASAHRHTHFDGPCRPGDFVVTDAQSNFTVASSTQLAAIGQVIGRVLEIQSEPRALLKEVKTAWSLSGMAATSQMPGSATKGFTDLITLSNETVADQIVIVNVRV